MQVSVTWLFPRVQWGVPRIHANSPLTMQGAVNHMLVLSTSEYCSSWMPGLSQ